MSQLKYRFVITRKEDGYHTGYLDLNDTLFSLKTGRWVVEITPYKKKRSLSQNAYYHSCVIPAVKDGLIDMGFDASLLSNENVHELLKSKFLKEDIANENGKFITLTKSTTELSTLQFSEYIEQIQQFGAEFLGINIPNPGEQSEMF